MKVSYKVIRVDQNADCMDVEFSLEGHEPVLVGVRIPLIDEDVDRVIRSFIPFSTWFPRTTEKQVVEVGYSGAMPYMPYDSSASPEEADVWAQTHYEQQLAKTLIKFGLLESDPTVIEVTRL